MITTFTSTSHHVSKNAFRRSLPHLRRFFRLALIVGPKVLLTSRISFKCAVFMTLLCLPAMLFSLLMTIPALIFNSPQQQAYFYFAKVVEQDPVQWIAMLLTGFCALIALTVPATTAPPVME
jgi:hypothetical protein